MELLQKINIRHFSHISSCVCNLLPDLHVVVLQLVKTFAHFENQLLVVPRFPLPQFKNVRFKDLIKLVAEVLTRQSTVVVKRFQ